MSHESESFHESNLNSAEYREHLMRKLNCLIAVLEVASAKVKRSLTGPAPDVERLTKIQSNLSNTLDVCRRARRALERRESLPKDLPANLTEVVNQASAPAQLAAKPQLPFGARYEMSSPKEQSRFEKLGRIRKEEVRSCDLDELARKLSG